MLGVKVGWQNLDMLDMKYTHLNTTLWGPGLGLLMDLPGGKYLWVPFLVGAGSRPYDRHGSVPCLHGTHDEVGTTKHNWSA